MDWSLNWEQRCLSSCSVCTTCTGVTHYSGSLFGLFGFVPNNQNTVLAQFFRAFRHLSEPFSCSSQGVGACRIGRKRDKSERSSPRGEWGEITLGNEVFRVPYASKWMNPKTEIYFCEGWYPGCTAKRWGRNVQFEESYPFLRVSVREKTSLSQINWRKTIRVI